MFKVLENVCVGKTTGAGHGMHLWMCDPIKTQRSSGSMCLQMHMVIWSKFQERPEKILLIRWNTTCVDVAHRSKSAPNGEPGDTIALFLWQAYVTMATNFYQNRLRKI
jgi:hypothetical protein